MKPRTVSILLEVQTEAALNEIRKARIVRLFKGPMARDLLLGGPLFLQQGRIREAVGDFEARREGD